MKHNIKINGEIRELDCQLGSGVLDKNGREIFEGDKVKVGDFGIYEVTFDLTGWHLDGYWFALDDVVSSALEIVA